MVPTASEIVYRPLPKDDPQRRRPDIARAKELLGWEPKIPLSEGLQQTADYFASVLVEPDLRPKTPRAKPRPGLADALSIGA
jgi:UDP-glucuronate decarboxylase